MERSRGDGSAHAPKRQRVSPSRSGTDDFSQQDSERHPLLAARPPRARSRSRTPPRHVYTDSLNTQLPKQQGTISHPNALMKEPVVFGSFLAGTPFIETHQSSSLPTVPRPPRLPQHSRAHRLQSLTSRLQGSQSTTTSQPSFPGGALRKSQYTNRLGPYDRRPQPPQRSQEEVESRLSALETRAKQSQSRVLNATSPLPSYRWGDEQVNAEFRRHMRRPSQKQQSVSNIPLEHVFKEESPKFDFKFSTPMPTTFKFGGQFTSPPRSGAPEYIRSEGRTTATEKAQFTFELPPSGQKSQSRFTPKQTQPTPGTRGPSHKKTLSGDSRVDAKKWDTEVKNNHFAFQLPPRSGRRSPPQTRPFEKIMQETDDHNQKNSFTILANQPPPEKLLIRKTLPKSQTFTYRIDTQLSQPPVEDTKLAQSFPQSHPSTSHEVLPTPSASPGHRRTKSVATPTRSSRRARFTSTYAEDSHREFIRELRQALGQQKAKKDQEEKAIEEQIKKLREEGQAVEKSLAGEIPRLPELLARKVHEALFDTPDDAVVVENSFGKLSGRDIHRLQKGEWLNDELINYYLLMLKERSYHPDKFSKKSHSTKSPKKTLPKTHVFSTFFYQLLSTRGYSAVRRWTKKAKVNLFDVDRVLIPINKGGFHWILCVVNVTEKRIEYYDSMGREGESSENRGVLQNVRLFMVEEAKAQNKSPDKVANWSFYVPVPYPAGYC